MPAGKASSEDIEAKINEIIVEGAGSGANVKMEVSDQDFFPFAVASSLTGSFSIGGLFGDDGQEDPGGS